MTLVMFIIHTGKRIKNKILILPIEPRLMDTFPSWRKLILLEQMRNTGPCSQDKGSENTICLAIKYDKYGRIFWCFEKTKAANYKKIPFNAF